jgi:hypothetical protein
MRDHMVRKVFQRRPLFKPNQGLRHSGQVARSINASRRRCSQAYMSAWPLNYFRDKSVAAENASRGIKDHQVACTVLEF